MWNNQVALYIQGIGKANHNYLEDLFRELNYEPGQYRRDDVQTKSEVLRTGDKYEQEATRVADHVVSGSSTGVYTMPAISRIREAPQSATAVFHKLEPGKSGG